LKQVAETLQAAGINYMVTGSVASSLQGEPRSSHDIDLVVAMAPKAIAYLLKSFPPPDYFLSEEAIREALRHRSMFNLLRIADVEKVDFWMP
jgi:hypothetical protein